MSIKLKVLEILEQNRDKSISGQYIAEKLEVSRSAVWKAIKALEIDGHKINATTNKGYRLENESNVISKQGIKIFLNQEFKDIDVIYHNIVTSTNDLAKHIIVDEDVKETVIIADKQTAGRGRMGREFYSPEQTGIYMSVVIKPKVHISEISIITIMTALIVCGVIEKFTNNKAEIKWVNDVFVNGKKVCGILTEAISNFENGIVENIIIGIGININTEDFPEYLNDIAGNITCGNINRNEIIAEIINSLLKIQTNFNKKQLIDDYREKLFILNREIIYYKNNKSYNGFAVDISENGELIVKNSFGNLEKLSSGEISLSNK